VPAGCFHDKRFFSSGIFFLINPFQRRFFPFFSTVPVKHGCYTAVNPFLPVRASPPLCPWALERQPFLKRRLPPFFSFSEQVC